MTPEQKQLLLNLQIDDWIEDFVDKQLNNNNDEDGE